MNENPEFLYQPMFARYWEFIFTAGTPSDTFSPFIVIYLASFEFKFVSEL